MFICNECLKDYGNTPSDSRSYGRCETCGQTTDCNDIPSKYLPGVREMKINHAPAKDYMRFKTMLCSGLDHTAAKLVGCDGDDLVFEVYGKQFLIHIQVLNDSQMIDKPKAALDSSAKYRKER
jgi:hypothetical protein